MSLKEKSKETKNRILKVAEECFAKNGFDLTGIAEICNKANVSKGGFYYHYLSKQALILELLNSWLDKLDNQLDSASSRSGNVLEFFYNVSKTAEPVFKEAGTQLPIFLELWTKSVHDPGLRKETIGSYRKYIKFFASMIEKGISAGVIRKVDPEITAKIIMSLVVGMLMQGLLDPKGSDWNEVASESILILIHGLGKK